MNARMNWWAFGLLFSVCCWHRENGVVLQVVVSFAIFIFTRPDFRDLLRDLHTHVVPVSNKKYSMYCMYVYIS